MFENCRLYAEGHHTHRIQAREARKEVLVPVQLSPLSLKEVKVTLEGKDVIYFQHNVLDLYGDYLEAGNGEALLALKAKVLFIRKHERGELLGREVWRPWSLTFSSLLDCSDIPSESGYFRVDS
jgi:hypothetical protein